MELNVHSPKPIYLQIEEILREEIERRGLKPHDPIPSEKALVERFKVSRMTVRRALENLARSGGIYRVHGKGAYVAEQKFDGEALTLTGLRGQMQRMGCPSSTQIIRFRLITAGPKNAQILRISESDLVYELVRIRLAQDSPVAFDTSYIPVQICPGLTRGDLEGESLYQVLKKKYGIFPTNGLETLEVTSATTEEAALLECRKGDALMFLKIQMYYQETPIEYAKVLFRGDKFRLTVQI